MKAITLHEPFAAFIAYGWKEVETRGWYTSYRGPLAIHAGRKKPSDMEICRYTFLLGEHGQQMPPIVLGAVVCVCDLVACLPASLVEYKAQQLKECFEPQRGWAVEHQFGNYDTGRWAWILRNVRRLDPPVPARGSRKLWDWKP